MLISYGDKTYGDNNVDILLGDSVGPVFAVALVLQQDVEKILLLLELAGLSVVEPLLDEPRGDLHRAAQVLLHLPHHSGGVHPFQVRQVVGDVRSSGQLQNFIHTLKELPRLRVLGVKQVPGEHEVADEVERQEEEEAVELDGAGAATGPGGGGVLENPALHVFSDSVAELRRLVHSLVDEKLHGAEAAEDAPVAAELVHAESALVEVVGGEDVGDFPVGEGEVVLLEELGCGGGVLDHHGVDGAEAEPEDGAVGLAPFVHGLVGQGAQLEHVAEDWDWFGPWRGLAGGFLWLEDENQKKEADEDGDGKWVQRPLHFYYGSSCSSMHISNMRK